MLTEAAWWVWVRAVVCACGSSGVAGPPGWCRLPRAKAGSWPDGGQEVRCWPDIITVMSHYTTTVRVRRHSSMNMTFFMSLYECLHEDFNVAAAQRHLLKSVNVTFVVYLILNGLQRGFVASVNISTWGNSAVMCWSVSVNSTSPYYLVQDI